MKKFIIAFVLLACACAAYSENESAVTSKEYVDAGVSGKQDTLTITGTNTVMTYDSSQSTGLGQKAIYTPGSDYATQQTALVTASTANAAIQNAINGEFVCYEYNPNDPTDCWLVTIKNTTPHSASKNLFNLTTANVLYRTPSDTTYQKHQNGYTVIAPLDDGANFIVIEFDTITDYLGKTLTISAQTSCTGTTSWVYNLTLCDDNGGNRISGTGRTITIPSQPDSVHTKIAFRLYAFHGETGDSCTYTNIQIEEGATATEYEPFENMYLPQNQQ
ncbi:MAG: hypothetical protein J6T57_04330 [Alphaproteobacteria bacterium]|nr:hypothetical protein [Alphaproteobacteria bacterium]